MKNMNILHNNEWHKVADDGDLPKNNTEVLVILKNKRMKISTFMENKFTIWNNDYNAYTKLYDVIAWCEIPTFKEQTMFEEEGDNPCPHLKKRDDQLTKAKAIIKDLLSVLPKENIEGVYETVEAAEQFLREEN